MALQCEFCPRKFERPEALRRHLHRKHRDKVKLAILEHPLRPETKEKPR